MPGLPFFSLIAYLTLSAAVSGVPTTVSLGTSCGGQGALSARLHGAVERELTWTDRVMRCEGSVRPDGSGLRLTAVGPLPGSKRELRILLGIAGARPGVDGANLAANLTLIVGSTDRNSNHSARCIPHGAGPAVVVGSAGGGSPPVAAEGRGTGRGV